MATGTAASQPRLQGRRPPQASRLAAARERTRRGIRRIPGPLALILATGALLSLAWNVALPAFQGPDEIGHYAYLEHLAQTGEIPSPTTAAPSREARNALTLLNLEALMGNLSGRPAWSGADIALYRRAQATPPAGAASAASNANQFATYLTRNIAKNPPLYYAAMAIPYRVLLWLPLLKRIFVLRLFNALCYLATIALTWLIAGELFGRVRWKQALAAGAVALEPQLSFMSAVINVDSLLIVLTTAFLLSALRLVKRGASTRRVLTASLLAAAAILTHGRGLVTVPVLLVALVAAWVRHRPSARERIYGASTAAATLGGALVAYLLLGRGPNGGSLYGGQVASLNSGRFNVKQFLSSIYQFYFPRLPSMRPRIGPEYGYRQVFINTFYGTFGSLEVIFAQRIYDVLQVLSAIGLVGFYTACVVRARRLLRAWPVVAVLLALLVSNLFFLHYVSYRALISDGGTDPLIVGRYLLPMISLFGVAIAFTAGTLPRRAGALVGAAILSLGVLLSLAGIGITAARFYA
jgi:4-amino-4-deoxy-L-arabinose transferase-like glycosyltransferase